MEEIKVGFVPGNFATIRAAKTTVTSIGGAFILHVVEDRLVASGAGAFDVPAIVNVEVGRFMMNLPSALELASNLLAALTAHKDAEQMAAGSVRNAIESLQRMLSEKGDRP